MGDRNIIVIAKLAIQEKIVTQKKMNSHAIQCHAKMVEAVMTGKTIQEITLITATA
jgi:hypothetical protein